MSTPSILLLGATGVSGLAFIKEALASAVIPKLTLYVRSSSKLPKDIEKHKNVRVVVGALGDEETLGDAMAGVDTVVSLLGAYPSLSAFIWRTKTTPIADDLKTVLKVMKQKGVHRILTLSTPSYYVPPETWSLWIWVYQSFPYFTVPQGNAEMVAIAKNVIEAGKENPELEWTVFRIPHLTEASADLPVAAGFLGDAKYKGSLSLSRLSQARWILKEIGERKWVRQAPVLGNY